MERRGVASALEKVVVDLRQVMAIDMPLEQLVDRASAEPVPRVGRTCERPGHPQPE